MQSLGGHPCIRCSIRETKECPGEADCLVVHSHKNALQARKERNIQAQLARDPNCGEKKMTI